MEYKYQLATPLALRVIGPWLSASENIDSKSMMVAKQLSACTLLQEDAMLQELINTLEASANRRIIVIGHDNADSDAIGAGFAVAELLGAPLAIPNKISPPAIEFAAALKKDIIFQPQLTNYDLAVIVDTASQKQLPGITLDQYVIIDHHKYNELMEGTLADVHEPLDSTCQLVYRLYLTVGRPISKKVALALAGGIVGDTVGLTKASGQAILELGQILKAGGIELQTVLGAMKISRRMDKFKRLRAASHLQLYEIGDLAFCVGPIEHDYLFYTTSLFIELGADLALAYAQEDHRLCLRLAKSRNSQAHCHALAMLKKVFPATIDQNLWGDEFFAGYEGVGNIEDVLRSILQEL